MKGCSWIFIALLAAYHSAGSDPTQWRPSCPPSGGTAFVPHPFDSGKLFHCLSGVAYPMHCPLGAQWNQTTSRCEHSNEMRRQRSSASAAPERNQLCQLGEVPSMPFYFMPDGSDHQRIVKCLNGYAYILSCEPGQYWNVGRNRCDDLSEQGEPQAISMRSGRSPRCFPLSDLGNLDAIPFLKNLGALFVCQLDESYIMMVIHLNDASVPAVTSPLPATPTWAPTTAPTTTTITTIHPNLPTLVPECSDASSIQRFGIPGECRAYLQCHQGRAYKIFCRAGRAWSDAARDCIDEALAGCSSNTPTTTFRTTLSTVYTRPPTAAPTAYTGRATASATACTGSGMFLPHPSDCHKFIQCDNGNALTRDCPPPLFWNQNLSICDWTCGQ